MLHRRLTYHCDLCSRNWPYVEGWDKCHNPECEMSPCRGLRLDTPDTIHDHIMDYDEALSERRRLKTQAAWDQAHPPPLPTRRAPTRYELDQLEADLDAWTTRRPTWLK